MKVNTNSMTPNYFQAFRKKGNMIMFLKIKYFILIKEETSKKRLRK